MKNEMSLKGYGVKEMTSVDKKNVEGGFLIWTPVDVIGGFRRAINGLAGIIEGIPNGHNKIQQ
jgi:hypothetical protein